MRLKEVVRANKAVTEWGEWQSGKMPRSAFPLSKSRQNFYRLGNYRWRVVLFDCLNASFRLLIALHEPKEQFRAFLGIEVGPDTRFVSSYEFHGTHPGWHAHLSCDLLENVPTGIRVGPWQYRMPNARRPHRRVMFNVTERTATEKAGRFFGLPREPAAPGAVDAAPGQWELDL
jgi:hypothetical protein